MSYNASAAISTVEQAADAAALYGDVTLHEPTKLSHWQQASANLPTIVVYQHQKPPVYSNEAMVSMDPAEETTHDPSIDAPRNPDIGPFHYASIPPPTFMITPMSIPAPSVAFANQSPNLIGPGEPVPFTATGRQDFLDAPVIDCC